MKIKTHKKSFLIGILSLIFGLAIILIPAAYALADNSSSNSGPGGQGGPGFPGFGSRIEGAVNEDTTLSVGGTLALTITSCNDSTTLTSGETVSIMTMPSDPMGQGGPGDQNSSDNQSGPGNHGTPSFNRIEGTVNEDTTLSVGSTLTITITNCNDSTTLTSGETVSIMTMPSGPMGQGGSGDQNSSDNQSGPGNHGAHSFCSHIGGTVNEDTTLSVGNTLALTITSCNDSTSLTSGETIGIMVAPSDNQKPSRIEGTVNEDTTLSVGSTLTITITKCNDSTTLTSGEAVSIMTMPSGPMGQGGPGNGAPPSAPTD